MSDPELIRRAEYEMKRATEERDEAKRRLDEATETYTACMRNMVVLGIPNTRIAKIAGVTETAVRKWRARNL